MSPKSSSSSRDWMLSTICPMRRLAAAVEPLERRVDFVGRRDVGPHALAGGHLHGGDDIRVGGVGDRERQLLVVLAQRHRLGVAQELRREPLLHERQLREVACLRERQVELVGERVGEVPAGHHAEAQQDHADLVARFAFLQLQGALEVGGVELAAFNEDFAEALGQLGLPDVSS